MNEESQLQNESDEFATIAEYIQSFPEDVQERLQKIYELIQEKAPKATEIFSYGMPTFFLKENMFHFTASEECICFYPMKSGMSEFKEDLKEYKCTKGSVKFPFDKELPLELIERIVDFRVEENSKWYKF